MTSLSSRRHEPSYRDSFAVSLNIDPLLYLRG
ncbi:hypothetical protein N499_1347, partial [Wolbachia pipientis wVitA]